MSKVNRKGLYSHAAMEKKGEPLCAAESIFAEQLAAPTRSRTLLSDSRLNSNCAVQVLRVFSLETEALDVFLARPGVCTQLCETNSLCSLYLYRLVAESFANEGNASWIFWKALVCPASTTV